MGQIAYFNSFTNLSFYFYSIIYFLYIFHQYGISFLIVQIKILFLDKPE